MKNYLRKKVKEEKAAVTLLVFVTVLTFVVVLLGGYLAVTTLRKSQLNSDIRIQEIYGQDVERVDEIYEELINKDIESPNCDIESEVIGVKMHYNFTFNEPIKNLNIENIKLWSGSVINTNFGIGVTLSTSSPAYSNSISENKYYIVSFDYKCISNTQEFEIGIYSDGQNNLPTKKLIAKGEIQHENYIIEKSDITAQFKMIAQIQDSNNITISNFKMIEINNNEVKKEILDKKTSTNYTLITEYNQENSYVIILDKGACMDLQGNENKQIIKII